MEWQHLTCQMVCWNMSQVTIRWKNPMTLKLDEEFVVIPYRCPVKESSVKPPSYSILLLWDFLNVPPLFMVLTTSFYRFNVPVNVHSKFIPRSIPAFVDLCCWFPSHSDLKRPWIFFHWKNELWTLKILKSYKISNSNLENILNWRFEYIKSKSIPFHLSFIFWFQACEGVDDLAVWDLGSPHCRLCSRLRPGPRAGILDILEDQVENEDVRGPGRWRHPAEVCSWCPA